jgi:ATP-dependent protease ClpP protease subunit
MGMTQSKTKYVIFTAEVTRETVAKLREAVVSAFNKGTTDLHLWISSSGGDVLEGLTIASLIRALPIKVVTHNIGITDSVANVIFAAGNERLAKNTATFLFHGVTLSFPQCRLVESQLLEQYKNCTRMREHMIKNFSDYCGVDLTDVTTLMIDGAAILSAEEARQKGIVHTICDPDIPAGVQITAIGNP